MKIITIASTKGGVGKSTSTVNIARRLWKNGKKVGIIDGDLTSPSIFKIFNAPLTKIKVGKDVVYPVEYNGIKMFSTSLLSGSEDVPIMFKGEKKRSAMKQMFSKIYWGELDYLLIDLAPGASDEMIEVLECFKDKIEGMVIVTTPSRLSVNSVSKLVSLCERKKIKIMGMIANMSVFLCPHCNRTTFMFGQGNAVYDLIYKHGIKWLCSPPLDLNVEDKPFSIIDTFSWVDELLG